MKPWSTELAWLAALGPIWGKAVSSGLGVAAVMGSAHDHKASPLPCAARPRRPASQTLQRCSQIAPKPHPPTALCGARQRVVWMPLQEAVYRHPALQPGEGQTHTLVYAKAER